MIECLADKIEYLAAEGDCILINIHYQLAVSSASYRPRATTDSDPGTA